MNFNSKKLRAAAIWCMLAISGSCFATMKTDVLIIGGGASGTAAGVQSARMGVSAIIVEETPWLGGMLTAAGVSAVDGNYSMPAGLFGEFRSRLADHYGSLEALKTGWVSSVLFEPSVGNRIFNDLANAEDKLTVLQPATATSFKQHKDGSWTVTIKDSKTGKKEKIEARVLIDATELGDVAKAVGVGYDIGMESRHVTGEDVAPENPHPTIVQDLTMVATLKDYGHDVAMTKAPDGYDPSKYASSCLNPLFVPGSIPKEREWSQEMMITYGKLPNGKYMINWPIKGNDYYVNLIEMTPAQREKALKPAKDHTLGFVYFIQHELGMNNLGIADDEYDTPDGLAYIPYHRESRRIHGLVRMDANHINAPYDQPHPYYRTGIAVGDYPVDHHHDAYTGKDSLPNLYFHPVPSYNVPMGVMLPRDVDNIIVAEKSISVSNVANGATRLQPVVVQLGQAAGIIAALAVKENIQPDEVSVRQVQDIMLEAGGYLMPYIDVPASDENFKAYQRIGASGLLRGTGRTISWKNETHLRVNDPMLASELAGFTELYPVTLPLVESLGDRQLTVTDALAIIGTAAGDDNETKQLLDNPLFQATGAVKLTRGEFALIADRVLDPFHAFDVTITGETIAKQ